MAKASDNEFPSVLFGEQSSAPSTPSSGTVRIYFDTASTPAPHYIDDSGTVFDFAVGSISSTPGVGRVSISAKTANYTITTADASTLITASSSSTITITVPDSSSQAFDTGSRVALARLGTGSVVVAETGSATVNADPGQYIAAQYGAAELIYYGSDNWLMIGRLSTS